MDTLDSFHHNFYSFYTNEMGIILKYSLPYSPYIIDVVLPFSVWIYHLFFQLSQYTKTDTKTDSGTKTDPWKKSHKMFKTDIYLQYWQK